MTQHESAQTSLRLRLLHVAGGDPAVEAKLREMLWQDYGDAGYPFGPTEEGLFRWLDDQLQAHRLLRECNA